MIELVNERRLAQADRFLSSFEGQPLKRHATKIGSGSTPRGGGDVYVSEGAAFLRSQNVQDGQVDLSDVVFIDADAEADLTRVLVHPGDVLLNITGGSIGRSAVFDRTDCRAYVSQHVCIVRPKPGTDPHLLQVELSTPSVQEQIRLAQVGGNREGLNFEQVGNLIVRVPEGEDSPEAWEVLDPASQSAARARELLVAQVGLLREHRQALITRTVTGESEVPGVAA
jgi:type I restriction enzyme S subunit